MITTTQIGKKRVYLRNKKGRLKKFGKIRAVVFHPSKPQAIGAVIKRPDFLLMFKRKERFVALDRSRPIRGTRRRVSAWASTTIPASSGTTCPS